MMRLRTVGFGVAVVGLALLSGGALRAQEPAGEPSERQQLAEALVTRAEGAVQRALDPRFRASVVRALLALSDEELGAREAAGPGFGPLALGDPGSQLVYTRVTPCRIIDTRVAGGSLAPGTVREFKVTGQLQGQGGNAAGCGVPFGTATAAVINFVAVNAVGPGNLRAWAYDAALPPPPAASILNYQAVPGLNLANELAIPLCTGTPVNCSFDFRAQADGSGTHLVADVFGYFERFPLEQARSFSVFGTAVASPTTVTTCVNVANAQVVVNAPVPGRVLVRAHVRVGLGHVQTIEDGMNLVIAAAPASCPSSMFSRVGAPATLPDGNYASTVPVAASFDVAQGTFTYYVNAQMTSGGSGNDDGIVPVIEATFHPN